MFAFIQELFEPIIAMLIEPLFCLISACMLVGVVLILISTNPITGPREK